MAGNNRNEGSDTSGGSNRKQSGSAQSGSEGGMSVREAGQRGGEATSASHGREFHEEIGRQGGETGGQRVSGLVEKGKQAEGRGSDGSR